jgi:hypothetical protein
MNDFQAVAAELDRGRVGAPHAGMLGAPWAGVGQPTIVFPPQRGGQVAGMAQSLAQAPSGPYQYTNNAQYSGANSYFGLTNVNPAENEIAAGAARTFKRKPEREFQPLQLIFASRVTGILIVSLSINNVNYLSNDEAHGIPVEWFSEVSQAMGLLWEQISTSSGCSIRLHNTNASPVQMVAGFAGIQLSRQ